MSSPDGTTAAAGVPPKPVRITSVDAYRGLVMVLMLAGGALALPKLAKEYPDNPVWAVLGWHQDHVQWRGCTLHDLIQPSFMFLVGVALPFSLANRAARGQSDTRLFLHAVFRAAVLLFLAVVHSSDRNSGTNWVFTNVLAQIALGYPFLFLLGLARPAVQVAAVAVILVGYWAFFALAPLPPADFDWAAVGVKPEWRADHALTGFAAHWDKNANPAARFDEWFLNLFPRKEPFRFNAGGYATLNFIPSLATMTLGLLAGGILRRPGNVWATIGRLTWLGLAMLAAGYALDLSGICPSVKRIWTPAWVLLSGGWCFLLLAGFHALLDTGGPRGLAFPLVVVGMNSIVAYFLPTFFRGIVNERIDIHLGKDLFAPLGTGYDQLARGAVVMLAYWLVLYWMYCRKLFVRI